MTPRQLLRRHRGPAYLGIHAVEHRREAFQGCSGHFLHPPPRMVPRNSFLQSREHCRQPPVADAPHVQPGRQPAEDDQVPRIGTAAAPGTGTAAAAGESGRARWRSGWAGARMKSTTRGPVELFGSTDRNTVPCLFRKVDLSDLRSLHGLPLSNPTKLGA